MISFNFAAYCFAPSTSSSSHGQVPPASYAWWSGRLQPQTASISRLSVAREGDVHRDFSALAGRLACPQQTPLASCHKNSVPQPNSRDPRSSRLAAKAPVSFGSLRSNTFRELVPSPMERFRKSVRGADSPLLQTYLKKRLSLQTPKPASLLKGRTDFKHL
jgi:hypothetical protein